MSVRTRVRRLEGTMAGMAVCGLCRGRGREAVRVEWSGHGPRPPSDAGDDVVRPEPEGCPRCKRVKLTKILVCYENRLPAGARP